MKVSLLRALALLLVGGVCGYLLASRGPSDLAAPTRADSLRLADADSVRVRLDRAAADSIARTRRLASRATAAAARERVRADSLHTLTLATLETAATLRGDSAALAGALDRAREAVDSLAAAGRRRADSLTAAVVALTGALATAEAQLHRAESQLDATTAALHRALARESRVRRHGWRTDAALVGVGLLAGWVSR